MVGRWLEERRAQWALGQGSGGLRGGRRGVLHEVAVWGQVAAMPVVTRAAGGGLRVIVVRGHGGLRRWRLLAAATIVLRGTVLAWGETPSPTILMERHGFMNE